MWRKTASTVRIPGSDGCSTATMCLASAGASGPRGATSGAAAEGFGPDGFGRGPEGLGVVRRNRIQSACFDMFFASLLPYVSPLRAGSATVAPLVWTGFATLVGYVLFSLDWIWVHMFL